MTSFFSRFFSDRYANHHAIGNNLLLLMMYRFTYPFACVFNYLRLTPNQLTVMSCLSAIAAFAALVLCKAATPFVLFWGLSLLLDFCDGTVARMSGQVSRTAFRFDHMSDLAKVSLVIFGVGMRYDEMVMWVLSSAAMFAFLYFSVLNQELKAARSKLAASATALAAKAQPGFQSRLPSTLRVVYAALATINGHTLLVFFALPFGHVWAGAALAYLVTVAAFGTAVRIRLLLRLPKP